LLDQRGALFHRHRLNVGPPLRQLLFDFTRCRSQQQEIVGRAKPRMIQ
jgi:hypothetical protein